MSVINKEGSFGICSLSRPFRESNKMKNRICNISLVTGILLIVGSCNHSADPLGMEGTNGTEVLSEQETDTDLTFEKERNSLRSASTTIIMGGNWRDVVRYVKLGPNNVGNVSGVIARSFINRVQNYPTIITKFRVGGKTLPVDIAYKIRDYLTGSIPQKYINWVGNDLRYKCSCCGNCKEKVFKCARCQSVAYCGESCKRSHAKKHKKVCKKVSQ